MGLDRFVIFSLYNISALFLHQVKGVDTDVNSVKEIGGFVALTVGVCQSRAKLSAAFITSFMKLTSAVQVSFSFCVCHG